jgi:hypothetical protein
VKRSSPTVHLTAALLASFAVGCAPALSTFQPAHVAPKHHVQAEIGMDVSIPTGTILKAIEAGEVLVKASETRELTEAEVTKVYEAGASLLLNPPSATPHIGVGFTVIDNLEISLRYATSSLRLGGRYQFLKKEKHKVDATVGLGLGYYVLALPLGDTLKIVELEDFSRFQIDVPLVFGTHGSWYRLWAGPRFMYTRFGTSEARDPVDPRRHLWAHRARLFRRKRVLRGRPGRRRGRVQIRFSRFRAHDGPAPHEQQARRFGYDEGGAGSR